MRRRDEPYVHSDLMRAAQALKFLVLQEPQEPTLKRKRHIADLVEKYHSPFCRLDLTFLHVGCSGERATFMPEQLIFNDAPVRPRN
jgi:hypothetical protein